MRRGSRDAARRDDQVARDPRCSARRWSSPSTPPSARRGRVRERRARGGGCETSRRGTRGGVGGGAGRGAIGGGGARRRARRSQRRVAAVDADATKAREHAAALEEETGHLTAQIEAFAVVNARLQDAATSAQSRLDAEVAKTANLKNQVATLEASLRAGRDERASGNPNFGRSFDPRWRNSRRPSRRGTRRARRCRRRWQSARRRWRGANARTQRTRAAAIVRTSQQEQTAAAGDDGGTTRGGARAVGARAGQNAQLEAAVRKLRGSAERLQGVTARERGEGGGGGDGDAARASGASRPPPLPPSRPATSQPPPLP